MHRFVRRAVIGAVSPILLGLAACGTGGGNATDNLDSSLVNGAQANEADPALTAALEDQIMVDPTLAQQANGHSVRPPDGPTQAPIPPATDAGGAAPNVDDRGLMHAPAPTPAGIANNPTLGELARAQQDHGAPARRQDGCDKGFRYSIGWADRLPASLPPYPGASATEAAGNDDPRCALRLASFTTSAERSRVIDWYYTHAIRGGFTAEHQIRDGDHVLAGTRGDKAYYILFSAGENGGTEVDVIANHGR